MQEEETQISSFDERNIIVRAYGMGDIIAIIFGKHNLQHVSSSLNKKQIFKINKPISNIFDTVGISEFCFNDLKCRVI